MNMKTSASGLKFAIKKRVKETVIKIELDTEYLFKIEGAIYKAKEATGTRKTAEDAKQEPPHLMSVSLLDEEGARGVVVVPHVLRTELEDAYPDQSYVGKMFQVIKHKIEGKRYNDFEINEIETDGELEASDEHGDAAEEDAYEEAGGDAVEESKPARKRK